MSLTVIIGKNSDKKSEYFMNKIMACKLHAILFVPSFSKVTAEIEYLKFTKSKAIIDKDITNISRFVEKNIDKHKLYESKEYLPDLAKKMLVRKVISENEDLLDIFKKVKDNTNFIDKICSYIDSASSNLISPSKIIQAYDVEDFLKKKLNEFGNIYYKVEENLKDRFVQSKDELNYYINEVKDINLSEYFFYDYNNFSMQELKFIEKLLSLKADVTICLDFDENVYNMEQGGIYTIPYNTFKYLEEMCDKINVKFKVERFEKEDTNLNKDIKYLCDNLFNSEAQKYDKETNNISCRILENTYEEIKYIAEDITKNIKLGVRFKDIAIYTNNMDMYYLTLKKILDMYNIPIYANETVNILSNKLVIYLINMLKISCQGLKKDTTCLLDILKTGLINIDVEDIYLFEKYITEYGIKGYMIEESFKSSKDYDLERLNNVREKILEYRNDMINRLSNLTDSKSITKKIYEHLNDMNIIQNYSNILSLVYDENVNEYNKQKQVVSKLYDIMDNICIAYQKLTLAEYIQLLEYGAKETKVDTIPEKVDQVYITDINKSRGTSKKIGYFIGMYDGGMPSIQEEDSIFTDKELLMLKKKNIQLKETSENRNNMQLFNILDAIKKVKEKLVFITPASNMSGSSLRPGILIQNIKNLMNIKIESSKKQASQNKEEAFIELMSNITNRNNLDKKSLDEQLKDMYAKYLMYMADDKYKEIIEYIRSDNNLSEDTLDLIYKKEITSSVSRLEQFKRCPFNYYLKYVLKLKENKEYVMTNMDTGSLMHEVLEKISKYIVAHNITWQSIVIDEKINYNIKEKISEVIDEIFEEKFLMYLKSARYVVFKNKLKKSMVKIINAVADSFNHSEFRPLGYEIAFEDGALFAPIKIELENKTIYLRGKIDRIDSLNLNNDTYLRIVDYKSSSKNIKLSDVKDGINLQLMTYMWAMLKNKEKINKEGNVIPAALSYFTITNKVLNIPSYEEDENKISEKVRSALKLRGIYLKDVDVLKRMDNNLEDTKKSYLEVSKYTMNKLEKTLPEDTFITECNNVEKVLKDIAKSIIKGNVKICPNSKIKDVCNYCKFYSVCRKNIMN